MKKIQFSALAFLVVSIAFLPSAYANHRTGSLILPELLVAGDFNQDGNLDVAANCTGFDVVAILFGDGQGGLTLGGHFGVDTLTKGLQVGDVNKDRHLDLVNCSNWGYDETVLLGDGAGAFHLTSPPTEVDGDGEPVRLLLRDFDNDGNLDILVNAPDDDKLLFFAGNGKGNFPAPEIEIEEVTSPFGMDAADFNKDGNLDAVVGTTVKLSGNSKTNILLGDGTGNFNVSSFATNDLPTSAKAGDLNNDGKQDVVVAGAQPGNTTGNFITTFLGDGAGAFTQKQNTTLGPGNLKGDIALGDFNEDGKLDVAFPKTGSQIAHMPSKSVLIFFGDGTGNLTAGPVLTVGAEPHTVIAVDVNRDGHLDLAVSNRTDGSVSVLLGNGSGSFTLSSTTSVLK